MTENNTPNTVSPEQLLLAEAMKQMQKSANRVSTATILAYLVEFLNGNEKTRKHVEAKYSTVTVARLRSLIKGNEAIAGKVWPIENEEFGICLVRIPQ